MVQDPICGGPYRPAETGAPLFWTGGNVTVRARMETRPELVADIAGRMMRWVTQPALREGRNIGGPRPPQVAARTLALAYVAGTTGNLSAAKLARRLRMTPRRFAAYTAEARREFGLRNPHFSGHSWNFR